ncbi:MAG: hypothetical protein IPG96_21345 [Proteobacteria bacterium]|nr:hypothetical protein [Pseudomonadota bacterium]
MTSSLSVSTSCCVSSRTAISSAIEIPGIGKGEQALALPAAVLDHAKEGAPRALSNSRKRRAAPRPARRGSTHWVLGEATPAVDAVPAEDRVERVKEALRVDQACLRRGWCDQW